MKVRVQLNHFEFRVLTAQTAPCTPGHSSSISYDTEHSWFYTVQCWRRLLRVPWTARRSNRSILKEINSEYLFEGLMLKLRLQNFGYLMWRDDSLEKTLLLGKIEGRRRRGRQRMRGLYGITNSMDMSLCKLQEIEKNREAWHAAVHGVLKSWTQLSNWKTTRLLNRKSKFL